MLLCVPVIICAVALTPWLKSLLHQHTEHPISCSRMHFSHQASSVTHQAPHEAPCDTMHLMKATAMKGSISVLLLRRNKEPAKSLTLWIAELRLNAQGGYCTLGGTPPQWRLTAPGQTGEWLQRCLGAPDPVS